MARHTGLGTEASTLLRPTAPPAEANGHPGPPDDVELVETEGRGDAAAEPQTAPARTRRKRPAPTGKTKARNLHLTDDVHDRLWQYARQRKTSVSTVANELLDKALPRYEVRRVS